MRAASHVWTSDEVLQAQGTVGCCGIFDTVVVLMLMVVTIVGVLPWLPVELGGYGTIFLIWHILAALMALWLSRSYSTSLFRSFNIYRIFVFLLDIAAVGLAAYGVIGCLLQTDQTVCAPLVINNAIALGFAIVLIAISIVIACSSCTVIRVTRGALPYVPEGETSAPPTATDNVASMIRRFNPMSSAGARHIKQV